MHPNVLDTIFKKSYRIFRKSLELTIRISRTSWVPQASKELTDASVQVELKRDSFSIHIEKQTALDTIFKKSYSNFFKTTRSDDSFYENLLISLSKQWDNRGVSSSALNCDSYLMRIENLFLAKFTKASKSPLINASFFALDHFLICFSFSIAIVISVNSQ